MLWLTIRLRDMREDHDLTQQKLAEYLGMPQPQYFRYEQGLRDIPTDILIQLAKLYNTTTDYLLGLTDDPVIPGGHAGRRGRRPYEYAVTQIKSRLPATGGSMQASTPTACRESAVLYFTAGLTPSVP